MGPEGGARTKRTEVQGDPKGRELPNTGVICLGGSKGLDHWGSHAKAELLPLGNMESPGIPQGFN